MGKNRIFFARWTPAIYWSLVSKPVSQDIQSICYCLHTGTFRLDTRDLLVAGVPISISSKYLYLYLALKVLTHGEMSRGLWRCMEGSAEVHGGVCRGVWRCVVGNDDQSNSNSSNSIYLSELLALNLTSLN